MTWQVPWVISGVTEVPLDVARVLAYAATGGLEGVIAATDLEVRALETPGASVRVLPGAFVALNRFAIGSPQSYIGYNVGEDVVAYPANNTASTRYDLVYAHVVDPGQAGGGAVAGPVETRIIQGVGSSVTKLSDVAGMSNQAGIALARVAVPATTSTIQQSHITDLRALPATRRSTETLVTNLTGSTSNSVGAAWGLFPNQATWNIVIPSWANRMAVVGHAQGLNITGANGDQFIGKMRVKAADKYSQETEINTSIAAGTKDTFGTLVAGDMSITKSTRGTSQIFRFEAIKTFGQATMSANAGAVLVLDVTFYTAVESTTAT